MGNSTASASGDKAFSYNFRVLGLVGAIRPESAADIQKINDELLAIENDVKTDKYDNSQLEQAKKDVLAVVDKILSITDSQLEDRTGVLTDTLKKIADNLGEKDRVMFTRYGNNNGKLSFTDKGFASGTLDINKIPESLEKLTSVPQPLTDDKESFKKAVEESLKTPWGGTPTPLGVKRALDEYLKAPNKIISKEDDKDRLKIFMLITDGIFNVRIDGNIWFDSNHMSRYASIANLKATNNAVESTLYHEASITDLEQEARKITETRQNASGEDENYILSTVYWKNNQTENFKDGVKFADTNKPINYATARAMFDLISSQATESLKNLTTKLAGIINLIFIFQAKI